MGAVDLYLATCRVLPEPDPDAAPLEEALTAAGLRWRWAVWNDPAEDWSAPGATLIRSTWDYLRDPTGYAAWAGRVDAVGRLYNPARIVRWNLHKRYLLALAERGVPTVPTALVPRGEAVDPRALCAARGWDRVVVKPAIAAGSFQTHAWRAGAIDRAIFDDIHRARDVLIQPYIDAVDSRGERSLVWIDGALSHAVRKAPRFADGREQVTGPVAVEPAERRVAEQALAAIGEPLLYARVDLVHGVDGQPMVAEVELMEPSLFFAKGPGALDRLVAGLITRLGRAGG